MATLRDLMAAVRGLRDGLHARLDDNVSDRVFTGLRLAHAAAVMQARREVEDPSLPATSSKYQSVTNDLAAVAIAAPAATDEPSMLKAIVQARAALKRCADLP